MASAFRGLHNMVWKDSGKDSDAAEAPPEQTSILQDITHLGTKNTQTMFQAFTTLASGQPINDKDELLENGVRMLQSLPPNSGLGAKAAGGFIEMLWKDLPHPAGTLAGPETKYRKHDGSSNNLFLPDMGKAGSPYCRSVPPMKPKGPNLPDPELVYEHLMKRKGPFKPHPSGLNRLFFSFATVVIHECFQTNRKQQWINDTSSYVDLSTLYGNTEKEQVRVRTRENGKIFPDSIASERIMLMPPGVVAVLIIFSRNHNHIVDTLLSINEEGKYNTNEKGQPVKYEELSAEKKKWQDEDLFQLGRNINVGFFASVVLRDYVAAILNTPRSNSEWSLNLGGEIKSGQERVERGVGNVVSVEFAVLYHWHATLSAADAKWMEDLIHEHLPQVKSLDEMTPMLFWQLTAKEAGKLHLEDPTKARGWEFGYIKRGKDGSFSDADLGKIIKDCIEEPAHAFGANGTPASLKVVDLMGQLQARNVFNVCTLNEFRRYLNLKAYDSFEEWNPDKEVAKAAELLYGHIEHLELYPGLQAECTKPPIPGSGVCPGQTTGRGILDDAVALVRGDRFLTYDFNSTTLTNWGVQILSDIQGGAYGGILSRLIFRGLPGEFTGTSSYAILPFYTPQAVQGILEGNNAINKYVVSRPESNAAPITIQSFEACKKLFEDQANFRVSYQQAAKDSTDGVQFTLGWNHRSNVLQKDFFEDGFEQNLTKYFRAHAKSRIEKCSLKYPDQRRSLDVVRDVFNVVPITWLAERFAIPLKTEEQPRGLVTTSDLFDDLLTLYIHQSFNIIPANEWKLREAVTKAGPLLRGVLETNLKNQSGGIKEGVVDWFAKGSSYEVKEDADRLYHDLNKSGKPLPDCVEDIIHLTASVAGNLTHQGALLVNLFLSPGYEQYKDRIVELAHTESPEADKELVGFVFEGMRHASVVPGLPRLSAKEITVQDGEHGSVHIPANHLVLLATSKASMDPAAFPNPEKLDPHRPQSAYLTLGQGLHPSFGARIVGPALAAMLKEVFKLNKLRRAPYKQGWLSPLEHEVSGLKYKMYLDSNARESPYPTSMSVVYDA